MNQHWIAAWGCPIAHINRESAQWMKDTTVRFNILMTVPGSSVKLHFSNLFNPESSTIARASIGVCLEESSFDLNRFATVTFNGGEESGTMEAGGGITSDPIELDFEAGETLTVSLYFKDFTRLLTGHRNTGSKFIQRWSANGDCTHTPDLPLCEYNDAVAYPFIHTIESYSPENCYSIVAYGDSITAQSWPDRLSRRLLAMGRKDVAIIRKAISGSRVLREYPCDLYRHYGPRGEERFEREVLFPGVKKVFILHGINDIIHPQENGSIFRPITDLPTAEELIEGLEYYIETAHKNGIRVFMSPILPFEGWRTYNEEKEQIREAVNYWIYRAAPIEGVLPFETAILNPENPIAMDPAFDSGDHLHPSDNGAQAMADSIPEEFI